MGAERKQWFKFNTAITAINVADGKLNDDMHRKQILPLRGRLMQLDGATGCYIDRYGLEVQFNDVTTLEIVEAHVQDAIRWAATQDGFFPLRGDKAVTVTLNRPKPPEPSYTGRLLIHFGSDVVALPVSGEFEGYDHDRFRLLTKPLAERITNFDGARSYQLRIRGASVTFDTQVTDREAVEAHLRSVLIDAPTIGNFFPYVKKGGQPTLTFEYEEE